MVFFQEAKDQLSMMDEREAKNEDEEEEEEEEEEGDEEKGGGKTLAAHQESDKIGDTSCGRPVAMFKPGLYTLWSAAGSSNTLRSTTMHSLCIDLHECVEENEECKRDEMRDEGIG
ncbi:hypothetical protein PV325_001015 [Microctonus aethiopoides]|nr:hypothetical protein PV325_001015 [Microctonus aethiopoides]